MMCYMLVDVMPRGRKWVAIDNCRRYRGTIVHEWDSAPEDPFSVIRAWRETHPV